MALQPRGLARGGEAGARSGTTLPLATSPAPRWRRVRRLPAPPMTTPRILGVDDWALRRGRTSGPLWVALASQRPLDLLPDRPADTLATWLRAHPGVLIIRRDRSTEYARGATLGAPEAQHVRDRWPLVRNLREPRERRLDRRHQRLAAILAARQTVTALTSAPQARALRRSTTEQSARPARRARRFARYREGRALHVQRVSTRHIARQLQRSRTTVIRS